MGLSEFKKFLALLVAWVLISPACGQKKPEPPTTKPTEEKPITHRSVLMVIAPRDFRDEEFKIPFEYLKNLGHKVTVASTDTIKAIGMLDLEVKPDLKLEAVDTLAYDAMILVGGTGSVIYWDNKTVHQLAKYFARPPKLLAAICLAPVTLARAGVLKDKEATVYKDRETLAELKKGGAQYREKDVVVCGNIITASGPQAAEKFAQAIGQALQSKE